MSYGAAVGVGLIMLVPWGLCCAGLLLGLNAMGWPPALALVSLAHFSLKPRPVFTLVEWLANIGAVLGVIAAVVV